jgi:hypothetical protein
MQEILNESLSKYVYHFTTMNALKSIMLNNEINFSIATTNTDTALQPSDYKYLLSVTRQSSPSVGYPGMQNNKNVRMPNFYYDDLTRYRLPEKYDAKKYTHVYTDEKGVNWGIIDGNFTKNMNIIRKHNETEERIISKRPFLKNAYSYIKRIDILTGENNLKVRIAFDGEKLQSDYKSKTVNYYYNKYINGLENRGKKEKISGGQLQKGRKKLSEAISKNLLMAREWNILKYFLQEIKMSIESDKGKLATKILRWFEKIYVHTNETTKHLGMGMLYKHEKDNNGILNSKEWGYLANKHSNGTINTNNIPVITYSNIPTILNVIYLFAPHNVNLDQKIKIGEYMCVDFFGKLKVMIKNEEYDLVDLLLKEINNVFIKNENDIKSATTNKDKTQKINTLYRTYTKWIKKLRNEAYPIYESFIKLENWFIAENPNINTQIPTYICNKYFVTEPRKRGPKPKVSYSEKDLQEMVNKVLERII